MMDATPIPRKAQQLGELLTISELRRLLAATDKPKYRLIIGLLFGIGLRAGEVGRLRLGDFDGDHRTLIIRKAKGGRHRVLPYDESLRSLLIAHYHAHSPTDFLFTSASRQRVQKDGISVRGVQYIVRQMVEASGINKKVCPHTLRHCFAVHYLNCGGNLLRLKQLLGHACISTTLRYLSYANPEVRDISSPLGLIIGA